MVVLRDGHLARSLVFFARAFLCAIFPFLPFLRGTSTQCARQSKQPYLFSVPFGRGTIVVPLSAVSMVDFVCLLVE